MAVGLWAARGGPHVDEAPDGEGCGQPDGSRGASPPPESRAWLAGAWKWAGLGRSVAGRRQARVWPQCPAPPRPLTHSLAVVAEGWTEQDAAVGGSVGQPGQGGWLPSLLSLWP